MNTKTKLSVTLLCAASVIALAPAAHAQVSGNDTAPVETVVVTGSRVISDAANSPTPLTVVSTAQLAATTPSNIPDALAKLPVFSGGTGARSTNNNSVNSGGSVLNLRGFGAQRTLVLMDGHRITPANADGTVDVDTLPQMLMQRVDVVTGGASAVYGSDAVTGVVNFILDKHFNGVKFDVNSGISNYTDAASYKVGFAAGTDLFGGRGHIEVALRRFYEDGVLSNQRRQGPVNWGLEGAGTAAAPYFNNIHTNTNVFGGHIVCPGCAADGQRFSNGNIVPFNPGMLTTTTNIASGGDGGHTTIAQVTSTLQTNEAFGRLSYNLDDTTSAYVQASASDSYTKGAFQNHEFSSGKVPGTFYKTNPYLTPQAQALLAGGTTSTFSFSDYWDQGYPRSGQQSNGLNRNLSVTAGVDGTWMGKYDWDLFFTHGEDRLDVDNPTNENQAKMYAGSDAVINSAGNAVCYVSTTQYANLYPGCVPVNPFSGNSVNETYNKYISQDTQWIQTTTLDDVGGSVSGNVFDLPAGPVKAALSAEARWMSLGVQSNASPLATVDCTGLRICNSVTPLYQNNTVASLKTVSENVWEFAGETDIPLLKDLPLVQSFNLNLAGRYTDYSTSGSVETWKIGLNYHVNDSISFRATNSVDIRAPTLYDLFSPVQRGVQSYNDLLTQTVQQNQQSSQGNPDLQPEVARTYTAGVVFTPSFLPGFTASVDYYNITLKNAITRVSGNSTSVQTICNQSGGSSPFCALYVRPLGNFTNSTPANFPTLILQENLNTAYNKEEGWDLEANYGFQLADVMESLPGSVNLRMLANIQPTTQTLQYPGAPLVYNTSGSQLPRGRVTGFIGYNLGSWSFNLENRWYSNFTRQTQAGQIYRAGSDRVPTRDYVDINIDKKFTIADSTVDGYLSIENVANVQPPVAPTNGSTPGLYYMGVQGAQTTLYDAIGRYYTIGVKAAL